MRAVVGRQTPAQRNWERSRIGFLVDVAGGLTPSKSQPAFWGGEVPWVSPKDMKAFHIVDSQDHITTLALESSGFELLPCGTVLMVTRGMILDHTVPIAITQRRVTINQDMKGLIARATIAPRFLAWSLVGHQPELLARVEVAGHGTCALRSDQWRNLRIPVPLLPEQTQIAKFLDYETAKIDALIEKQQQLIALLKEKRQAVISHAVTKGLNPDAPMRDSGVEWLGDVPAHWEVTRLKHIADVVDCRNKTPEYFEDGDYFVVRTTNVKEQLLRLDESTLRTDRRNFEIWSQRGVPPIGSILFTREAPTGEVCLVPENAKLCMGQRMMNFIPHSKPQTEYLFSYLLSDCLTRYIGSVSLGSTVSHLRVDQVENIPVPVPPRDEASAISDEVVVLRETMKVLVDTAHEMSTLLAERRTALISAAVTGKIDVRTWTPPTPEAA